MIYQDIEETNDIKKYKQEIDAIWSTFRLPVPVPRKIHDHDSDSTSSTTTTHGVSDEWFAQALDLLRLVDVMKNPPREIPFLTRENERKRPWHCEERVMQSQVRLAYSMLERLQRNFPLQNYNQQPHHNEHMQHECHQSDQQRQQLVFHQNIFKFMENLTKDTLDICEKFQSRLDRQYALKRQQQDCQPWGRQPRKEMGQQQFSGGNGDDSALFGERDLIYDIFLSSDQECPFLQPPEEKNGGEFHQGDAGGDHVAYNDFDGSNHEDFDVDSPGAPSSHTTNRSPRSPHQSEKQERHQRNHSQYQPRQEEIDPIEFQKQQQNLLEEELSTLASRLKSSTLAMNATLQTQTNQLDDMEQIAQNNLDSVSSTTRKVEDRLKSKKGWKKRLATWSLIGVVVGMWVFCFMVMRTVPKRRIVLGDGRAGGSSNSGIGISALWKTCKEYLPGLFGETEEQRYYREQNEQWLKEELEREKARQKREQELREQKRREARRERQRQQREQELLREEMRRQEQKKEEERMQKQQQEYEKKHTEQECEILEDGTQVCSEAKKDENAYKKVDVKAHEMAAERRRQRIEERMRNAPTVTAVDVTEDQSQDMRHDKTFLEDDNSMETGKIEQLHVEEEKNRCIPTTAKIRQSMEALDSLGETMANMLAAIEKMPQQTNKDHYTQALKSIDSNIAENIAELEKAKIEARDIWLKDRRNQAYAKQTDRTFGDIPFCEGPAQDGEQQNIFKNYNHLEEPQNHRFDEVEAMEGGSHIAEEDLQREQLQQKLEKERAAAEERAPMAFKMEEESLRLEEEQRKQQLEQEANLEERERMAIEEQRKREGKEQAAAKESDSRANGVMEAEQLRLEEEEKRTVEEEQRKKVFQERLEIERDEEKEHARVAKELQSERLRLEEEQKRIAEEEKRRREQQEREQAAAEEKARIAKEIEAERLRLKEEAKIAEEKRKKEAEEAARIAAEVEAERLRVEEERRQQEKAAAEAQIIAEKKAELERERLERERIEADRLAAEEKAKQEIESIKNLALELANQAREMSREIVLEDPDFIASDVRFAAGRLTNDLLAYYISVMPEMMDAKDGSGWSPIHEAARAGNVGGVQLLISAGADVSLRTGRGGKGGTALWWAIQRYGEDHDVVKLLRAHGAPEIGPHLI